MKTIAELRQVTDKARVHASGMIRRFAITATSKVLWKLQGFQRIDGKREEPNAEAFTGIGFFSRPPASGKPECIAVLVGDDATAPVIVAVRDEKTRAAIAALGENETAIFNSDTIVRIKNGVVFIGSSAAVDAVIKGTTYRAAEDILIAAMSTAFAAINTYAVGIKPIADPTNAFTPALTTALTVAWVAAVTTFTSAGATYLATKAKVS